MSDNRKSRFSKERLLRFFDKEGFYIILFLCVCIVAITAVWVSRTGVKNDQDLGEINSQKPEVTIPSEETSNREMAEKPNLPVVEKAEVSEERAKSAPDNNKVVESTPSKAAVASSQAIFGSPIIDGLSAEYITKDYSTEELFFFDTLGEWKAHLGLDIKAEEGTEVLAVYGGKILDVRNDNDFNGGLGWTVVIDHGNGYRSVYANLSENIDVKKDQSVRKGQKIGSVGKSSMVEAYIAENSGNSSHLHFELLKKNAKAYENVDPKKYMTMQK